MPFTSLSQAYRITPRAQAVARPPAPAPTRERDADPRRDPGRRGDPAPEADHSCDSVRHSPLLRALLLALRVPATDLADIVLERALIAFARALNLATGDVDVAPQPAAARAGDAAQRRARNEENLLAAFAELRHAAGHPAAPTREALQSQLGDLLQALARHLHVDDDRAGEATQPGSLISVRA